MKRTILAVALLVGAAGCEKPPPEPLAVDQEQMLMAKRVALFGEAAKAPGIVWRGSGLGIRVLAPGAGPVPGIGDTVRVHYVGRLKDGTVFDGTRELGKPKDLSMGRLIAGWAAAMQTLRPGGRAEFFIPPALGYGGMQAGRIPPGSGLVFEVELLAINPAAPVP